MSQWIDFEDFERLHALNSAIGIFIKKGFEHSPDFCAILGKDMPLPDLLGSLASRERWLVECDMADEVKRVVVQTDLLSKLDRKSVV